jgi:HEAT repeat protein
MPSFYFDYHDGAGIEIDDEGVDLPGIDDARRLALEALGQTILDRAHDRITGRIAIEVRDHYGPILRASAAIVLEDLRPNLHVTGLKVDR